MKDVYSKKDQIIYMEVIRNFKICPKFKKVLLLNKMKVFNKKSKNI